MFDSRKLQKQCTEHRERVKAFGDRADRLNQRLNELATAETLEEMRYLPGHTHELRGNMEGQLAVEVTANFRLIFEPADEPAPRKADGGLDWTRVTKIRVLDIEDYHGD